MTRFASTLALLAAAAPAALSAASTFDFTILPPTLFPTTHFPTHAAAIDLDGDGNVDLVVPGRDLNGLVYLMYGAGDGTFGSPTAILAGGQTDWVDIGDVDGDGLPDLVFALRSSPSGVTINRNAGSGTFMNTETIYVGREIRSLALGDFDQDGDLDIAALDYYGPSVHMLINDGTGSFELVTSLRLNEETGGLVFPQQILAADIDGDGDLDLVVTSIGSGRVSVLINRGDGTFRPEIGYKPPSVSGTQPAVTNSAIGDMDGDGDLDIISPWIMGFTTQLVGVFPNLGAQGSPGAFGAPAVFPASPLGISWVPAVADLDGDGKLDIAVGHGLPGPLAILRNLTPPGGPLAFDAPQVVMVGQFVRSIIPVDVDNDGDMDLVMLEAPGNAIWILLNQTGQGGIASAPEAAWPEGTEPKALATPATLDRNRDGRTDGADLGAWLGSLGTAARTVPASDAVATRPRARPGDDPPAQSDATPARSGGER
ncbi:MAG TPA: VCBS repeat-containing protein [Phycisphaerales bacterium]|nr:VCBS repeat-containing protein [Phycisphaerales bacterium]HMP35810.1 VCBS repeat-containing protein [Phycisphaerales bacterium]